MDGGRACVAGASNFAGTTELAASARQRDVSKLGLYPTRTTDIALYQIHSIPDTSEPERLHAPVDRAFLGRLKSLLVLRSQFFEARPQ